jgi:phage shock protein PspC (stress-responsive transcriptional regulator)
MNKTVTINISGIIFHIEEEAYERLSKYLNTIRSYFSNSDGQDEIMTDIESRIAELLQEKISPSKQVVTGGDVDYVMDIMGKPEDFAEGDQSTQQDSKTDAAKPTAGLKKRLFRDPDNKVIGGVCGGISAYFDLDPVWIRIILVALTFLGFSGVLVYIILWIVVPEAQTTAEKLQMRGEPIDINTISKSVQEEAGQIKNRATDYGKKTGSARNEFFMTLGDVIKRLVGLFLIMIGVSMLIGFLATSFGFSIAGEHEASFNEFTQSIFPSQSLITLAKFSILLAIGMPIVALLYAGIKLLFNIKFSNRWINISLAVLWLTGVVLCVYTGLSCYENFDKYSEAKEHNFISQPKQDTLYIGLDMNQKYNNPSFLINERDGNHKFTYNDGTIIRDGNNKIYMNNVRVHLIPNHLDSLEILVVKSARGRDEKDARLNAYNIEYSYLIKDSAIQLNNFFYTGVNDKWRNQEVNVYLKIPKDKVIYLDPTVKELLYDVENTTNTYDEQMVNRRWRMTPIGLTCIDCQGLEKKDKIDRELEETKEELKEIKNEIKEEIKEEKRKLKEELEKIK